MTRRLQTSASQVARSPVQEFLVNNAMREKPVRFAPIRAAQNKNRWSRL
jgi:hypothetical protein